MQQDLKVSDLATKDKTKSDLLAALHETAAGFEKLGFIDQRQMRKFDALCLEPLPDFDAEKIKSLRARQSISQTVLASLLNISPSTVRQWEAGAKHPSGSSLKLLHLIERKGLEAVL